MVVVMITIWDFVHASEVQSRVLGCWYLSTNYKCPGGRLFVLVPSVPSTVLTSQQALKPAAWLSNRVPVLWNYPSSGSHPKESFKTLWASVIYAGPSGLGKMEISNSKTYRSSPSHWQNWNEKPVVLKPCSLIYSFKTGASQFTSMSLSHIIPTPGRSLEQIICPLGISPSEKPFPISRRLRRDTKSVTSVRTDQS